MTGVINYEGKPAANVRLLRKIEGKDIVRNSKKFTSLSNKKITKNINRQLCKNIRKFLKETLKR